MNTHDTPEGAPPPMLEATATAPARLFPQPNRQFRHTERADASVCANPTHDHYTTDDGQGGTMPDGQVRPMTCGHDGWPTHWDEQVAGYVHDDPTLDACPLSVVSMNGCLHPAPGVGDRVMFRDVDMPTYADRNGIRYDGVVWTVVSRRYNVRGQMDPETRAQIQAGHAHLILVGVDGRRVGTTSCRVEVAEIITVEIVTHDQTWAGRHGRVVRTDPVATGMGRATTVHVDVPHSMARRDRVGNADVVRFAFPDGRPPRDMPAVGNTVPVSRVVWGDVAKLARVTTDPRRRNQREH